jgi:tetratricopeptide (TPR) repeat protein
METLNKYLFQALDAYPYNLEETAEALQYALSYDDKSPTTLMLLGRLYSEQFCDFETAKTYFQEALSADLNNKQVYRYYSQVLIMNDKLNEAEKLTRIIHTILSA